MKTLFNISTLILILALFALPVFANEATEEAPESPNQPVSSELPSDAPITPALPELQASVGLSALVVFFVAIAKRHTKLPAPEINLYFSIALFIVYKIAGFYGLTPQLESFSMDLAGLLNQGYDFLLGVPVVFGGAAGGYHLLKFLNMPYFGTERPAQQSNERPEM